jgi:hypothetical protein
MKKDDTIRAKRLLTDFIRQIAQEQTEVIEDEESGGRMATKAEALARLIWRKALGFKDVDPATGEERNFPPDKDMINLVYDRLEGKAGIAENISGQGQLPKRISDITKNRLNKLANDAESNDNPQI